MKLAYLNKISLLCFLFCLPWASETSLPWAAVGAANLKWQWHTRHLLCVSALTASHSTIAEMVGASLGRASTLRGTPILVMRPGFVQTGQVSVCTSCQSPWAHHAALPSAGRGWLRTSPELSHIRASGWPGLPETVQRKPCLATIWPLVNLASKPGSEWHCGLALWRSTDFSILMGNASNLGGNGEFQVTQGFDKSLLTKRGYPMFFQLKLKVVVMFSCKLYSLDCNRFQKYLLIPERSLKLDNFIV